MKKIKGLLLFGILTLLGIGSSFGTSIQSFFIMKDVGTEQFNGILGLGNQGESNFMYVLSGLNSLPFTFNSHSAGVGNDTPTSSYYDYGINGFRFRGYSTSSGNVYFNNGFDSLVLSNSSTPSCLLYDSVNGGYLAVSFFNIDGVYQRVLIHNGEVIASFPSSYITRCIYGVGNSLSIMFGSSSSTGDLLFYNVFSDSDGVVHIDSGYAVVPIYSSGNDLSGSGVLVVSSDSISSNLIFNYYDVFSSNPDEIRQGNLINKGYSYTSLSSYDFFYGNFLAYSNTSYSNISKGFYPFFCSLPNGEDLKCFSHLNYVYSNNNYYLPTSNIIFPTYNQGVYSLTSDSSAPEINLPSDGGNSGNVIDISGSSVSSLYWQCLGPVYNTPDGLPPEFCYDSSGNLNVQRFSNCYNVFTSEYEYSLYCTIDGFTQEVNLVQDGSGYAIVPGTGFSVNFLNAFDSTGYSVDYFENYLNRTGLFFKCPRTYDNDITLRPKLISLLNGSDILLPINCSIAGFSHGKNILNFDNSGHFVPDGPLLNFEGTNWKMLYLFFDVLMSIGIIIFVGKIFYFFHK